MLNLYLPNGNKLVFVFLYDRQSSIQILQNRQEHTPESYCINQK